MPLGEITQLNDPLVDSMQSMTAEARRQGAGAFATSGKSQNRRFSVVKEKEPTLDDLRHSNESADEAKARFQRISKQNIKGLLEWRPASAKDIGVEARWLRRLQRQGLGYASRSSRDKLERLAEFFSLSHFTHLWREDLLKSLGLPGPKPDQVESWLRSPHWKQADKLIQLLDTGEYGHLSKIIDDCHELATRRSVNTSTQEATESKSLRDFLKSKRRNKKT